MKSQTRTWNVTDLCGNTATPVSRTVTWKVDLVKPVITATGTTLALGCNPDAAAINAALGTATALDICDGTLTPTFSDGAVTGDCMKSQTRTWNVTDICGNTATPVSRTVTWKVDLVKPVITASGTTLTLGCNPDAAAINAALGIATALDICDGTLTPTFSDGAVTGDCMKSQTRTWNVTDICGNTATPVSRTVTWKVDLVKPVITATGTTLSLGCNPDAAAINAALGTATTLDNCDGTLAPTFSDGAVAGDCMKSQTRTWNVTDLCGNTATPVSRTVTWKVDLVGPYLQDQLIDLVFECNDPVVVPVPVFLDNCDKGDIAFISTIDGVEVDPSEYEFTEGETEVCFTAADECGNTTTECIIITVNPCRDEFCTYTQGFYGNQNGKACDLITGGIPATDFTASLLAQGDLVIGAGGNTITFGSGDASILKSILPGGSGVGVLLPGACDATPASLQPSGCLKPYLTKQGKLNNGLLAQTITLGLNLRIHDDGRLADFELQSGKYLTTQKKVSCEEGSELVESVCTLQADGITYIMTVNPFWEKMLPANVVDYLISIDNATVQGLYDLANQALGGVALPAGVTLSDIANAIDLINNAFDECRVFVEYRDAKFECPELKIAKIAPEGFEASNLKVYPNPFTDKLTFEFVSSKDSHAVLEINNILGQKITTLMSKQVKAGVMNRIEYSPENVVPGILIYRLILDGSVQNGRVVYMK
jgi:hypothetical protein